MTIRDVFDKTDHALLARQRLTLLEIIEHHDNADQHLTGLMSWIDALVDAAADEGVPIVWMDEI